MKKIFFSLVILVSLGFLWFRAIGYSKSKVEGVKQAVSSPQVNKKEILKFALVADSENDNDDLKKALDQMRGVGVNFVIGLGDWSSVGTIGQLTGTKKAFDESGLKYYLTPGDHDLWDSRNRGEDALYNYSNVLGQPNRNFETNGVNIDIVDNSDIYKGIDQKEWDELLADLEKPAKLHFVFSHKTPFHPTSAHIMGEGSSVVTKQAGDFMKLMEDRHVDGFFSGDLHFFAQFNSPANVVKITTIGAVDSDRNFQGPRFAMVTVWDDYTWGVDDVEIIE